MFVTDKIGEATIHTENMLAACEVLRVFNSHKTSPLLISEPQQGKTEVAIATAHFFIDSCIRNKETYQVIVITHLSDNALRDQTRDRFEEAGLIKPFSKYPSVEVYHHSDLVKKNKIKLNDVSKRLIILDECHIALGFDRPLHAFLKECGIDYGKAVAVWQDTRNYVLSISATPYAQEMRNQLDKMVGDKHAFTTIKLQKSPDFFGIFELMSSGRPKQMETLLSPDKKSVSKFTMDRLQEFKDSCTTYGNGYFIIRGNTRKFPKLKEHLRASGIAYKEYSQDEANIIALSKDISQEPDYPVVILIKNAMRAGKTLLSTKYIRGILESEESNPDSASQAVCRSCGFKTDDDHSKFDDKYPIYCDLQALDEAALFYDYIKESKTSSTSGEDGTKEVYIVSNPNDTPIFPKGINNTTNLRVVSSTYSLKVKTFDTADEAVAEARLHYGHLPQWERNIQYPKKVSCNTADSHDYVASILNGHIPTGWALIWHFDEADKTSQKHMDSWARCETEHPEYIGKFLVLFKEDVKTKKIIIDQMDESMIKEDCLLS